MNLTSFENEDNTIEVLTAQKRLRDCKKFLRNASSIYLDLVNSTGVSPYIAETNKLKKNAEQCFTMLIKEIPIEYNFEKTKNLDALKLKANEILKKIYQIEHTKTYTEKAIKAYFDYIKSTGAIAYANQIKEDMEIILGEIDVYLSLYNDIHDELLQRIYTVKNETKQNDRN